MEIEIVEGCVDRPDSRDYPNSEIFGAVVETLATRVLHSRTSIQNQALPNDPPTGYGCTCFADAHAINEGNAIEYERAWVPGTFAEVQGKDLVAKAVPLGLDLKSGWALQDARKMAKNLGYIDGWTVCVSVAEVKRSLLMGQLIHTGSNKIDWKRMNSATWFLALRGAGYGHSFILDGFDDEFEVNGIVTPVFIARNSYGPKFQSGGRFYIRQSDFDLLFSCAAFVDKSNADVIRKAQSVRRRAEAKERGIWNGENENAPVTRYEAFLIAKRASSTAFPDSSIWNGERRDDRVTRGEAKLMLERAFGKPFAFAVSNLSAAITRGEMAELSVRL